MMSLAARKRFAFALLTGSLIAGIVSGADIDSKNFKADDLFNIRKVWNVDFVFTPDQWQGIIPKYSGRGGSGIRLQGPEGARNGLSAAGGIEFDWTHGD